MASNTSLVITLRYSFKDGDATTDAEKYAEPPQIVVPDDGYVGYFQNEYGEQLVFVYRAGDTFATLWHSDCEWKSFKVTDNGQGDPHVSCVTYYGGKDDEYAWLSSCWWATAYRRKKAQEK